MEVAIGEYGTDMDMLAEAAKSSKENRDKLTQTKGECTYKNTA